MYFSVTRTSGKISPASHSISLGKFSLVTILCPYDRAHGLIDFCGSPGVVNDDGYSTLGVLPLSGLKTSSQRGGGGFPQNASRLYVIRESRQCSPPVSLWEV